MRARPAASAAISAMRMYWGTAALLTATVALCLAVLLPVTTLLGTPDDPFDNRLRISTVRGDSLGLSWVSNVQTPAETQRKATEVLFGMLAGMAVAMLGASTITVVTLFGARAATRATELAVRRAVGASTRDLRKAALLEASAIAVAALVVGCALGLWLGHVAVAQWPGVVRSGTAAMSLALICLLAGLVSAGALLPIIFARRSRIVEAEPVPRAIFGPGVLQLAVSLSVLTTSGLLARHATEVAKKLPASSNEAVIQLTTPVAPPGTRSNRYSAMLAIPRTSNDLVSLTSPGALVGLGTISSVTTDCGECSEGGIPLRWHVFYATHHFVSPDSFRALGVRLVTGRVLAPSDRWETRRVAVVNRALAIRHFQRAGAVGRVMLVGDDKEWYTVVGIVDDPPAVGFGTRFQPLFTVYLSVLQHPVTSADLFARVPKQPNASMVLAREALTQLAPLQVEETRTTRSDILAAEAGPVRWFARWIRVQGWAIMLAATVGMFAVMRLWVLSLLPELGVRRALGAGKGHVILLVLRQAAKVALFGVAAGLWFGSAVWNVLPTIMTGAATWDTGIIARLSLVMIAATVLGALLPVLGAVNANPARLLSHEGG